MADIQNDKDETPVSDFLYDTDILIPKSCEDPKKQEVTSSNALNLSASMSKDLEHKDKRTDIWLKRGYGLAILIVLGFWEWFVIMVVFSQLSQPEAHVHYLSDTVLVALLTSATANILALPTIILKYLFPHKSNT